jgi:hypothetical protein
VNTGPVRGSNTWWAVAKTLSLGGKQEREEDKIGKKRGGTSE